MSTMLTLIALLACGWAMVHFISHDQMMMGMVFLGMCFLFMVSLYYCIIDDMPNITEHTRRIARRRRR